MSSFKSESIIISLASRPCLWFFTSEKEQGVKGTLWTEWSLQNTHQSFWDLCLFLKTFLLPIFQTIQSLKKEIRFIFKLCIYTYTYTKTDLLMTNVVGLLEEAQWLKGQWKCWYIWLTWQLISCFTSML